MQRRPVGQAVMRFVVRRRVGGRAGLGLENDEHPRRLRRDLTARRDNWSPSPAGRTSTCNRFSAWDRARTAESLRPRASSRPATGRSRRECARLRADLPAARETSAARRAARRESASDTAAVQRHGRPRHRARRTTGRNMYAATITTIAAAALSDIDRLGARPTAAESRRLPCCIVALCPVSDDGAAPSRSAMVLMIVSPWKRPFSMKMFDVSLPQMAPPARNTPGHVRLERVRIELGRHRVAMQSDAGAPVQIAVGMIARSAGTPHRREFLLWCRRARRSPGSAGSRRAAC